MELIVIGGIFSATSHSIFHSLPHRPQLPNLASLTKSKKSATLLECCQSINSLFLKSHAEMAKYHLEKIEHIIIYLGGELSIWKRHDAKYVELESIESAAKQSEYLLLKTLSHVTVLITIVLESIIKNNMLMKDSYCKLSKLYEYLHRLILLNDENVLPHLTLIKQTLELISKVNNYQKTERIACLLDNYIQNIKSINEIYALQATKLQLHSIDNIMKKWMDEHNMDLLHTRVLIVGTHGPREGLIEQQYFHDLYKKNEIEYSQENNVIYIEMLFEQITQLNKENLIENFLSQHEINKVVGEKLLGDGQAMFKDVLGKFAPQVLNSLSPPGLEEQKCQQLPANIHRELLVKCPYRG